MPYLFVAPALALLAILGLYTVVYGILLSFVQWNGFSPNWTWVGLGNYADVLFRSPEVAPVVSAAAMTTLVVIISLPVLTVAISLPLAFVLNSAKRFKAFFRTVFFLPYVTGGIAVYYAWVLMYQPTGIINTILRSLGLGRFAVAQGYLATISTALPAVIAVMVWSSVPLGIVLYMAGLQTIDQDLIDAVKVDGGGPLRTLSSIVWPMLRPITAIVLILGVQAALQGFAIFLIMTNGGPLNTTNTLGLEVYSLAFGNGSNIGYANALAWILFLAAVMIALVLLRLQRRATS